MGTLARLTEQELWAIAETLTALPNPALWRLDESSMPGQLSPCIAPAFVLLDLLVVVLLLLLVLLLVILLLLVLFLVLLLLLLQLPCDSQVMHDCQACYVCMPSVAMLLACHNEHSGHKYLAHVLERVINCV